MKRLTWLGILGLVFAVSHLVADDKPAKFDPAKLIGTWEYVSVEVGGAKKGKDDFQGQKVEFTKDKLTLTGDQKFVFGYELDVKKNPVFVKLTMLESPFGAGMTAEGIIELSGDELKLCYGPMGEKAPAKFEAKEGTVRLLVLKRAK